MICLHCKHVESGQFRTHASVGLGQCNAHKLSGVFVSLSYQRECKDFSAVADEVVAERDEWFQQRSSTKEK